MHNIHFIVGFDHNARFVHLFHEDVADMPVDCKDIVGEPLGKYATNEVDARLLRSTFAECLFTGHPQECQVSVKSSAAYSFRFEKVRHRSVAALRPEDEVVILGLISRAANRVDLTERERQIVTLICRDLSNADIARQLEIKESTVETHRQNIRQKLDVRGTAGIVLYAIRQGLVE